MSIAYFCVLLDSVALEIPRHMLAVKLVSLLIEKAQTLTLGHLTYLNVPHVVTLIL